MAELTRVGDILAATLAQGFASQNPLDEFRSRHGLPARQQAKLAPVRRPMPQPSRTVLYASADEIRRDLVRKAQADAELAVIRQRMAQFENEDTAQDLEMAVAA